MVMAFDYMEFCLVRDLTMDGNKVVLRPKCLLLGALVLFLPFIPGSKYLLPVDLLLLLLLHCCFTSTVNS